MFASFDYVKNPNKWFNEHKEYYEKICMKAQDEKNKIKLVKHGCVLYISEPFQSFSGDCESCSNFEKSRHNFVVGGECLLHRIETGWGFICPDNDSEENNGWEEFERIKGE